ncbi:Invasion protein IalB, involved in pathogenesis [Bosea sp. CRIB-10]|uniref:invasion associated locus B family protein n=1 Tax=Bosea sp. CRIB-10 TaxID=378404 RepID=UPI0008E7C1C3|nr:invasion associated locus B family protein [Bosea sp. CRIB-10]SFB87565.1 Invasion protein IalB, involved in pathogenesis [Bosea sp. CRIB-10]
MTKASLLLAIALLASWTILPTDSAFAQAEPSATEQAEDAVPAPRAPTARPAPSRPAPRPAAPAARQANPPARPATAQVPAAAPSVSQPAATAQLPNGASAVNEVYGDWTVDCRINDGQKLCLLSQSQGDSRTNQRVFAIELRAPKDGRAEGTILMPFWLKLENGAVLKLDDRDLGQGLRFSTCTPSGCLLPVSFPTVATDAMKNGKTLTAAALNLSNNDVVSFNIALNGFGPALDRLVQLAN